MEGGSAKEKRRGNSSQSQTQAGAKLTHTYIRRHRCARTHSHPCTQKYTHIQATLSSYELNICMNTQCEKNHIVEGSGPNARVCVTIVCRVRWCVRAYIYVHARFTVRVWAAAHTEGTAKDITLIRMLKRELMDFKHFN